MALFIYIMKNSSPVINKNENSKTLNVMYADLIHVERMVWFLEEARFSQQEQQGSIWFPSTHLTHNPLHHSSIE